MPVDLVFVLKWVKSVIVCMLHVFHFSGGTKVAQGTGHVII